MPLSERVQRDRTLKLEIARVFAKESAAYGVHNVWLPMTRKCPPVARCAIARLMHEIRLA
uniref:IS3 family transposase n=1 Tax=Edaphosphingomonas laterariae TaxID=861865 RepID=UPI003CCBA0FE